MGAACGFIESKTFHLSPCQLGAVTKRDGEQHVQSARIAFAVLSAGKRHMKCLGKACYIVVAHRLRQ